MKFIFKASILIFMLPRSATRARMREAYRLGHDLGLSYPIGSPGISSASGPVLQKSGRYEIHFARFCFESLCCGALRRARVARGFLGDTISDRARWLGSAGCRACWGPICKSKTECFGCQSDSERFCSARALWCARRSGNFEHELRMSAPVGSPGRSSVSGPALQSKEGMRD